MMVDIHSLKKQVFQQNDYKTWVKEALKGGSEKSLHTPTYEGITLKPIYTEEDLPQQPQAEELPGFHPFVRGTNELGYLQQAWYISQETEVQEVKAFNKVLKEGLASGQTMIQFYINQSVDRGLKLSSVKDLMTAFKDIPLTTTPLYLNAGHCSLPLIALFHSFCTKMKIPTESITGTIGMDPLNSLVKDGFLSTPLPLLFDVMKQPLDWSISSAHAFRPILVNTDIYHQSGASAVDELAFAIATGSEYLHQCIARGANINEVAPRMTFSFSIGSNLFMEIAKLRAVKILWSTIVEAYGGGIEAQKIHIHACTSTFTKTQYDPYLNIVRGTTEAFAAVLGGIESLQIGRFDELNKPSTPFSRKVSRNIQLILQEETAISKVIDPAGGSWYIESLTKELADKAWALFQQIEARGGMIEALKDGFVQAKVNKAATERKKAVRSRQEKIVGTNMYVNLSDQPLNRKTSIAQVKVDSTPKHMCDRKKLAINESAIIDFFLSELDEGATLDELYKCLEADNQLMIEKLIPFRLASDFETLRQASDIYLKKHGERPKVGLLNWDYESQDGKKRADFAIEFFQAGGFELVNIDYEDELELFKKSQKFTAVVCSGSDQSYHIKVEKLVPRILAANPAIRLFLVGKPQSSDKVLYLKAGIKAFISPDSNCYDILLGLHYAMEVKG